MRTIAPRLHSSVKLRRLEEQSVHELAASLLEKHLPVQGEGEQSSSEKVIDVLLSAASGRSSIEQVTRRHRKAPSANTVRSALKRSLTEKNVEKGINGALVEQLSKRYWNKPLEVAVDLHQEPYYGRPEKKSDLRVGPHKAGTHRFHTYASVYTLRRGRRVTLAVCFVNQKQSLTMVLRTLKRYLDAAQLRVGLWLADKAFGHVEALRWFSRQEAAYVALSVYGRKDPPSATRALAARKKSALVPYTMSSHNHSKHLHFSVAVVRFAAGPSRSGRSHKRARTLLYAMVGTSIKRRLAHLKPSSVAHTYSRRFGVESSYRQLHQGRARTCSRSVLLRLLFIGLSLLLRNLWVFCCWALAAHPGPGARSKKSDFTLEQLLHWIQHYLSIQLDYESMIELQAPSPLRF
jgi:putative transposase